MPLTCDPNAEYEFVLTNDKAKPEQSRPVFVLKILSCSKWREASKLHEKFRQSETVSEQLDVSVQLVNMGLKTWKNLKTANGVVIDYDIEKLLDILTVSELAELMGAIINQNMDVDDKKKSEPPSACNTELSAENVPAQ